MENNNDNEVYLDLAKLNNKYSKDLVFIHIILSDNVLRLVSDNTITDYMLIDILKKAQIVLDSRAKKMN